MPIKQLAEGLHVIRGLVNVYLLETTGGLALVDSGFPGSAGKILRGIRSLGKKPSDIRHILLTHAHPDHIGSAAALKRETGAMVWAHPLDAPIIETGSGFRDAHACPGLRNRILASLLRGRILKVEPTRVDRLLQDGESPSFAPDLTAIHVPGHCAGQLAFHWQRHGGVLLPADTCVNRRGLKLPVAAEDLDLARGSLDKLRGLTFESICFMHGRPIMAGGDAHFRRAWAAQ